MSAEGVGPTAARAREALRTGNALLCFDIVERARQRGTEAADLEYLAILALAHCGNTQLALDRYHAIPRTADDADQDWLALEGRLFKDMAQQGGAASHFLFERAAQAYWVAFQKSGGYYSAINAATMFMCAGDLARAQQLARDVLQLTAHAEADDENERYNLRVSHAEAALLLGDLDDARGALREADAVARNQRAARARTARQLRLICKQRRFDRSIPDILGVAPQLFVYRRKEIAIDAAPAEALGAIRALPPPLLETNGAIVTLAVLAPVDLCVIEHFLANGAQVTAVIPGDRQEQIAGWRETFGAAWAMQLAHVLDRVTEQVPTPGFLSGERQWMRRYVAAKALGLSRHRPEPLEPQWLAQVVEPDKAAPGFRLASLDGASLRDVERSLADIHCPLSEEPRIADVRTRELCALVAVDWGEPEALDDDAWLFLRSRLLAPLAERLAPHAQKRLFSRNWGTTTLLAAADAQTAAAIAFACTDLWSESSAGGDERLRALRPRILAHFGPAFLGDDAFGDASCFGFEIAFATAQVRAVPPGGIFASEAFYARAGLEGLEGCRLEYVGALLHADTRGSGRLFSLRRS